MWSKIVGHKRQIEELRRSLESARLPNAYVFAGPAGVGKRLAADAFAAALLCPEAPSRGHDACGECLSCRKLASGNHPDFFLLEPEESERGAVTSIKTDPVRELMQRLIFKPLEAQAKVAIIDGADRLMPQAANSLLKTLEEPPERTHFILVTPLPHRLLPTIRSRCRLVAFSPLGEEELAAALVRRRSMEPAEATRIARLAGGSMGLALRLEPEFVAEVLGRFLPLFSRASSSDIMEAAQAFAAQGPERLPLVFDILMSLCRDMLRVKATGSAGLAIHPEAEALAGRLAESKLMRAIEGINGARIASETAANKQLMFEDLLFTLTS
ncbi:MAG: DNA polymerase III subunit delta' [Proteobacteria bacterium]|nr:DNA polymerase III subunit delta' [Pseudomonadota bacterium]